MYIFIINWRKQHELNTHFLYNVCILLRRHKIDIQWNHLFSCMQVASHWLAAHDIRGRLNSQYEEFLPSCVPGRAFSNQWGVLHMRCIWYTRKVGCIGPLLLALKFSMCVCELFRLVCREFYIFCQFFFNANCHSHSSVWCSSFCHGCHHRAPPCHSLQLIIHIYLTYSLYTHM